jgi:glycosyltransferase involved in cell wall biosynthesis
MDMTARLPVPADDGVLLVHDYLLVMRGAERTFEAMTECFPAAELAALLYDPVATQGRFRGRRIRTSFLQPVAAKQGRHRRFLPLLPLAAEWLPVDRARLVISSSSAFAHGVRPAPDAVHVCYCHSPFRYVWHERDRAELVLPAMARPGLHAVLTAIRRWDQNAARRVTTFVANSELTRRRIKEFYGRDALVVHPPVDVERFTVEPDPQDYFLTVGEVTRHKNTEIALAAAERAGVKLKVVGDGPDLPRVQRRFAHHAEFLGRVDDHRLTQLYARCRALVVPAIEEFGITMVEAHAAGRPVLAAAHGGALEIVSDGATGKLVAPGSVEAWAQSLRGTDWESFDPATLRASAARFSRERFRERFMGAVTVAVAVAQAERPQPARITRQRRQPARIARPRAIKPAAVIAAAQPVPGGPIARSSHRP